MLVAHATSSAWCRAAPPGERHTAIAERHGAPHGTYRVGIEGAVAIAAAAQAAAEAEDVGCELEEFGHMLGAQRAGEAGKHVGAVRCRDERLQGATDAISSRDPRFLSKVSSMRPAKPASPARLASSRSSPLIGEQHADEQNVAELHLRQPLQHKLGAELGAQSDLDDVDTGAGHGVDGPHRRVDVIRRIADRGAHRHVAGHARADGLDGRQRQRAQRALQRVLGIDDVGGEMGAQQRLRLVRHAGEQPRRSAHVFHRFFEILFSRPTLRQRCAAAPSAPSRGRSGRPRTAAPEHPAR